VSESVWIQSGAELHEYPISEVEFDGRLHRCVSDEAVAAFAECWVLEGEAIGETRGHTPASADHVGTPWLFVTLDQATFRGVPAVRFHFWDTVDNERDLWKLDDAPFPLVFGLAGHTDPARKEA
jgi:hypothetical protein